MIVVLNKYIKCKYINKKNKRMIKYIFNDFFIYKWLNSILFIINNYDEKKNIFLHIIKYLILL